MTRVPGVEITLQWVRVRLCHTASFAHKDFRRALAPQTGSAAGSGCLPANRSRPAGATHPTRNPERKEFLIFGPEGRQEDATLTRRVVDSQSANPSLMYSIMIRNQLTAILGSVSLLLGIESATNWIGANASPDSSQEPECPATATVVSNSETFPCSSGDITFTYSNGDCAFPELIKCEFENIEA